MPTAHTLPGLMAVMPEANWSDLAGVGEVAAVQAVPFQRSNSSWIVWVAWLVSQPAAHRFSGPVPEMEVSTSLSPGMLRAAEACRPERERGGVRVHVSSR